MRTTLNLDWARCPLAQAGFVRIVSNPAFSSRSVSVQQVIEGLAGSLRDDAHQFWPDSIPLTDAMQLITDRIRGHQQIRDAYLVALAMHNRGKLATLDRGITEWAPAGSVELIA
jgi:toxin-antitoxin system PIN domain toxin